MKASPKAKCRLLGCSTCVPRQGHYVGMPQSHCTRCGKATSVFSLTTPEFDEPDYPEADWPYQLAEWVIKVFERRRI